MNNTSEIENYPGYDHISGPELSMNMHAPLEKFGVENIYGIVKSIEDAGDVKRVITEDTSYEAKTIILATGANTALLMYLVKKNTQAAAFLTVLSVTVLSSVIKIY